MEALERRLAEIERKRSETWKRLRSQIIVDMRRRLQIPEEKTAALLPEEFPPDDWIPPD